MKIAGTIVGVLAIAGLAYIIYKEMTKPTVQQEVKINVIRK